MNGLLVRLAGRARLLLVALIVLHVLLAALVAVVLIPPDPACIEGYCNLGPVIVFFFLIAAFLVLLPLGWAGFALPLVAFDVFGAYWAAASDFSRTAPLPMVSAGVLFAVAVVVGAAFQVADAYRRLKHIG